MNFGWLESLIFGVITGLTEILPVSALAHSKVIVKFMGRGNASAMMCFFVHLGILGALYLSCLPHILKIIRAKNMARIPKRKRKRPLDTKSLMDLSLWITMMIPVVLGLLLFRQMKNLVSNMIIMATFLFLNGLILYIPQFLPSGNKDCRSLSRLEGLFVGLGGALFAIPGLSGIGTALSVASISGIDRKYGLSMVLLMQMGVVFGESVYDLMDMISGGVESISVMILISYLLAAAASFLGAYLAVKLLRFLAEGKGYGCFAYYSWGAALFTFVLSLMA